KVARVHVDARYFATTGELQVTIAGKTEVEQGIVGKSMIVPIVVQADDKPALDLLQELTSGGVGQNEMVSLLRRNRYDTLRCAAWCDEQACHAATVPADGTYAPRRYCEIGGFSATAKVSR